MNKDETNDKKPAGDKLHSMFGEEQSADQNLAYNVEEGSYELDKESDDPAYDHPLPYETSAKDGMDISASYDEANPYVGDEYEIKDDEELIVEDDPSMRIDNTGNSFHLSKEDELLARTEEDDRTDLDEEGYPLNDQK